MSKPGTIYRFNQQAFDPTADVQLFVDISDNDNLIDDADDANIIEGVLSGNPFKLSIIDNTESPFKVIKAQQATIEILSSDSIRMSTFSSGSDQRWGVLVYFGSFPGTPLFVGYLVLPDMSTPFMPDPNVVTLTANDGLGLLKTIPITDFDDVIPYGYNRLIDYLAWALSKTGLQLTIKAAFNIKLSGFTDDISIPNLNDQHLFSTCYRHSKDFYISVGETMNCYEAIERMLGPEACLVQRQGEIFILRMDEIEHPTRGLYVTSWNYLGVLQGNLGEKQFPKSIVKPVASEGIFFSREATKVINDRAHKSVKLIFNYEFPNYPNNKDFSLGDLDSVVSPTESLFDPDSWRLTRGYGTAAVTPNCSVYIRRIYDANGYETERYLMFTQPSAATAPRNWVMSDPIPINIKDKFEYSFDYSATTDNNVVGNTTIVVGAIVLFATDGTKYYLGDNVSISGDTQVPEWKLSDNDLVTNADTYEWFFDATTDLTEWNSYNISAPPAPKSGDVYLMFFAANQTGGASDDFNARYQNIRFTYLPLINGSYTKFTGQSQEVTQAGNFKAKFEEPIYMSESPNPQIIGTLFNGLLYVTIFSGSVTFVAPNLFKIAGHKMILFTKGQRLNIQNTTSNNKTTQVTGVAYSIVGAETIITVRDAMVNETDATTTIQELTFERSDLFYNAAVEPAGPASSSTIKPYSEIQVFDVWNQFRTDMRVFQATCQGMNLDAVDADGLPDNAHLVHKWSFDDINEDTINRFFALLTFDMDFRTAEWTGTFREVGKKVSEKMYEGRVFKYLT